MTASPVRPRRFFGASLLGALVLAAVAACSSTTAGTGALQSGVLLPSSSDTPTVSPATTAHVPTSQSPDSSTPSSDQSSAAPLQVTSVTGTGTTGATYEMSLWAKDMITDCAAHSHGTPIINYFKAHPCRSAYRRLWTLTVDGRMVAMSIVTVQTEIKKVNNNPDFSAAQQFRTLENADNTGSINDLLREGKTIPGVATSIPSGEVFTVTGQDGTVVVIDAWYTTGTTSAKDARLSNISLDLALSDASAPQ